MTKFALVSAVALVAASASAQSYKNGPSSTGLSVRLGVFFPLSTAGTDIGNEWFAGGLDYKLSNVATASASTFGSLPAFYSISADYYAKDSNRSIPVVLHYNVKVDKVLYSVGVGAEDTQLSGSNSTISFAAQAAISYDLVKLPIPIFIQAKYFYSNHEEFRGIGAFLGARF